MLKFIKNLFNKFLDLFRKKPIKEPMPHWGEHPVCESKVTEYIDWEGKKTTSIQFGIDLRYFEEVNRICSMEDDAVRRGLFELGIGDNPLPKYRALQVELEALGEGKSDIEKLKEKYKDVDKAIQQRYEFCERFKDQFPLIDVE